MLNRPFYFRYPENRYGESLYPMVPMTLRSMHDPHTVIETLGEWDAKAGKWECMSRSQAQAKVKELNDAHETHLAYAMFI